MTRDRAVPLITNLIDVNGLRDFSKHRQKRDHYMEAAVSGGNCALTTKGMCEVRHDQQKRGEGR